MAHPKPKHHDKMADSEKEGHIHKKDIKKEKEFKKMKSHPKKK